LNEEIVSFGGRDYSDNSFGGVEGFETLSKHNVEVVGVDIGRVGEKAENDTVNIGIRKDEA
jgi:hypothetical protein